MRSFGTPRTIGATNATTRCDRPSLTSHEVDRRRAHRTRPGPLRVRMSPSSTGTLVDISASGALVRVDRTADVDTDVTLDVEWGETVIQLHGRVVRTTRASAGARTVWAEAAEYDVAVHFTGVSAQAREVLSRLAGSPSHT